MSFRSPQQLMQDARAIWQAGTGAVDSSRLIRENIRIEGDWLLIGEDSLSLKKVERIVAVGAGKAGAGMAQGLVQAFGDDWARATGLSGWINVPADCVVPLPYLHLHAARPAGKNEPTAAGVRGAEEILKRVQSLGRNDLCLCLLSGGGSALLPAPAEGITLEDKLQVTRLLSENGANIRQLNTVRKHLSRIKGGGLARNCRAGRLYSLIISDVLGDPLDVIASGPTVADQSRAAEALEIIKAFAEKRSSVPAAAWRLLEKQRSLSPRPDDLACEAVHLILGNNAAAVDAAGMEAERRGYSHAMHAAVELEGSAEEEGEKLARMAVRMRDQPGPDCLITGGEPVVQLAPVEIRGKGGRNQQLVLAALCWLKKNDPRRGNGIVLLSGGTDGEDGPTDAAGAIACGETLRAAYENHLDPFDFLHRNDAYSFFAPLAALLKTGPTHTNVCDVRVAVVERKQS